MGMYRGVFDALELRSSNRAVFSTGCQIVSRVTDVT